MRFQCKNCGSKKYWKLADGSYRCRNCRRDSKGYIVPDIRFTNKEWVRFIDLFLIGANGPAISQQLKRSQAMIGKASRLLRIVMTKDVPDVFEGIVEVDETYLGGQKKNKNKSQLRKEKRYSEKKAKEVLAPPNSLYLASCAGQAESLQSWFPIRRRKT